MSDKEDDAKKERKHRHHHHHHHRRKHSDGSDNDSRKHRKRDETATLVVPEATVAPVLVSDTSQVDKRTYGASLPPREEWMNQAAPWDIAAKATPKPPPSAVPQRVVHEKELNPYLKAGGSGLPSAEDDAALARAEESRRRIGDGGAGWRRKAMMRAAENAQTEGRDVADVVRERFGEKAVGDIDRLLHRDDRKRDDRGDRRRDDRDDRRRDDRDDRRRDDRDDRRRDDRDDRRRDDDLFGLHKLRAPGQATSTKKAVEPPRDPAPEAADVGSDSDSGKAGIVDRGPPPPPPPGVLRGYRPLEAFVIQQPEEEEEEENKPKVDINQIAAQMFKAKIMGNAQLAADLQKQLDDARKAESTPSQKPQKQREEVVIIRGRGTGQDEDVAEARTKRGKAITYEKGQTVRHYADDDGQDLASLVAAEKAGDRNYDSNYARNVAFSKKFKDQDTDAQFDTMDPEMWEAARGGDKKKKEGREKNRAIATASKQASALDRCWFCLSNPKASKHLVVAMGVRSYLALPAYGRLEFGHCLIVPFDHVTSLVDVDDDVLTDIRNFKKCLVSMFRTRKQEPIFFETVTQLSQQRHTFLECVPLPADVASSAPAYFKKSILESDVEWSTNAKLLETSSKKTIRQTVPKGFPYFHVEFGVAGGFVHVIEDELKFPRDFAKQVLGGMMELDTAVMRGSRISEDEQRAQVTQFAKVWKPHDWTTVLEKTAE